MRIGNLALHDPQILQTGDQTPVKQLVLGRSGSDARPHINLLLGALNRQAHEGFPAET